MTHLETSLGTWRRAVACGVLAVGLLVPARGEDAAKTRSEPERSARLRRDGEAFLRLPADKQERIRRLDAELNAEDPSSRDRLSHTLERYAAWLERLPVEDRQRIEAASDSSARLRVIRDIRQRQWVERQPQATRDQLNKLSPTERAAEVAKLQADERRKQQAWQAAILHWEELMQQKRPPGGPLREVGRDVQAFVKDALWPVLTPNERESLRQAEDIWPTYPWMVATLAEKHPMLAPGAKAYPTRFAELPDDVRQALGKQRRMPQPVRVQEGRWPDYPIAVTRYARRSGVSLPRQLGPARLADFPAEIQAFLDKKLLPVLTSDEKKALQNAEGLWPDYPQEMIRVAGRHGLAIPGMMLPGPREEWEKFRSKSKPPAKLPDVPRK